MNFQNKYDKLLDIRTDTRYKSLIKDSTSYLTLALSTPRFEAEISRYLAEKYNMNTDVYDKAIDAVYNQTNIGGPLLHHNLDGSHTWAGAVRALQEAFPDDSDMQNAYRALVHLARDMSTPSGINPFLTPTSFLQCKQFLVDSFHIPPSVANDLLNINTTEICGAAVATIAILLDFDDKQMDKLGRHASKLSLSSYLAGNPALLLLTAVCLGRICYGLWKGESVAELLNGTIQGGLSAGTFFYVTTYFPGPIFIGLAVAAMAYFGISWFYKRLASTLRNDLDRILELQFSGYRSYYKLIK